MNAPTATASHIRKALSLSTAHCPTSEPEIGPFRHTATEYGWILWLYEDATDVPEWLQPIVALALKEDARMIEFDCDEPTIEGLPSFDW